MTVFVTGALGLIGQDVLKELLHRKNLVIASDNYEPNVFMCEGMDGQIPVYKQLDIRDRKLVIDTISNIHPDAIIHCAAWTDVDAAEDPDKRGDVFDINVRGTRNIVEAAKMMDSKMLFLSTDYVFSGEGTRPWDAEEKVFQPLNIYGQSKLEGEFEIESNLKKYFIVRTSWVYGSNGRNFVELIIDYSKNHKIIKVVNDQIGQPTYSRDLAKLLVDMIETDKYGYYHATNEGDYISWYDYACEICNIAGIPVDIVPVTTKEYARNVAKRPLNSRLDKAKLASMGFEPLPKWEDALRRYIYERE